MYRLYRKMTINGHFFYVSYTFLFEYNTNGHYYVIFEGDWMHLVDFLLFFDKGGNFCDFLIIFLNIKSFLKWVISKRKEFAPMGMCWGVLWGGEWGGGGGGWGEANSFLLEWASFQNGAKSILSFLS